MTHSTDDERLVAELVRAGDAGLQPNAIAAGAGGQRHRPEVARLARDPEAVLLLRQFERRNQRARRVLWGAVGIAACLVAGLVFVLARGEVPAMAPLNERLARAVEALREEVPERFADFALVDASPSDGASGVVRGGVVWLEPRGTLWTAPKELRWRRPGGAGRVLVTVRGPDLDWRREVDGDAIEAPPLVPGRYVARLRALDDLAGQTTRRSFVVASEEERAEFERARELWQQRTAPDLHDLVEAHYAFTRGYFERALAAARRAREAGGEAHELAAALLRRLQR